MVTKAEIQAIDFNTNTCTIRMPFFENAAGGDTSNIKAIIATVPGIYNGYKVGDIVVVGFDNGQLQTPCVLGKLYLGAATESQDCRGSINCNSIKVNNNLELPLTTKIVADDINNKTKVAGDATTYKTIKDVLDTITTINNNLQTILLPTKNLTFFTTTEQLIGNWVDNKPLFRKAIIINKEISKSTSFLEFIDLSNISFDNIWVDLNNTLQIGEQYSLNEYSTPAGDYWNTFIDIPNKKIYYRGKSADNIKKFIIVLNYTKK